MSSLKRRRSSRPPIESWCSWVRSTASRRSRSASSACARKSGPQSTTTLRAPQARSTDARRRRSRGSSDVHVSQSQAIRGMPVLVPDPRMRTRSSPASGPGSPGSKPGSRPSASWSSGFFRPPDAESPGGGSADPASASARRVALSERIPSPSRRITTAGPPAATRSSASLASASAARFSERGTWRALQRRNRASRAIASAWSGASLASLTRQRPRSCSTISIESSRSATSSAPSSSARARARSTPVYSATLLVWRPSASETVAIGGASGRSAPGASASIRTAPHDAGPGLPRAAPSVRTMSRRGPAPLRPCAPRSPARPPGWPA